jgi:hypothetical protein
MPSLQEWEKALSTPKLVEIDSSENLANQVNLKPGSKRFSGRPKIALGLTDINIPNNILLASGDLLLQLGRITTPTIPNLVDLSSTWARSRYIWAFDPGVGDNKLRLSPDALHIDFHQKGLLSDELGVGMASFIVQTLLEGYNPIDVFLALQNQQVPGLSRRDGYKTSPDYLFVKSNGQYIVVECKGTISGRSTSLKQLRRGLEQVPSLEFPAGQEPLTIVIGMSLTRKGAEVFIVDPPSEKGELSMGRNYSIKDETRFRGDVENNQLANLYFFAGATGPAINLLPNKDRKKYREQDLRMEPPERIRVEELEQDYVGNTQSYKLVGDQKNIRVFQGLNEGIYNLLEHRDLVSVFDKATRIYKQAKEISKIKNTNVQWNMLLEDNYLYSSTVSSEIDRNTLRVNIVGLDGSLLRVEVS